MISTLEKFRLLEQYIATDTSEIDPVLDLAIDKLITRERKRILDLCARLTEQLKEFEQKYALGSSDFYKRYESGEMGDEMDFVEWASTIEMQENAKNRLALLARESNS